VRPGRAANHSPPSSAAVMEDPLDHTGPGTGSLYLFYTHTHTHTHTHIYIYIYIYIYTLLFRKLTQEHEGRQMLHTIDT